MMYRAILASAALLLATCATAEAQQTPKIYNTAKQKLAEGKQVVGGTVYSPDPNMYCAMANAGYDFIWTEMQHNSRDWESVARMWNTCPHAKAVPGVRVAYTDEREIHHALDAGALVESILPATVPPAMGPRLWDAARRSDGLPARFAALVWGEVRRPQRRSRCPDQRAASIGSRTRVRRCSRACCRCCGARTE